MLRLILLLVTMAGWTTVFAQDLHLEWAKSFGSPANDYGFSTTADADGNMYTTGIFGGTIDFDPGPGVHELTSVAHFDIFVLKQDRDGNYVWAVSVGGPRADGGYSIALDKQGNVYYAGDFGETVDFDPGPGVHNMVVPFGGQAGFISKLDNDGNFLWAEMIDNSTVRGLKIDDASNVFAVGTFFQTVDFDPGVGVFEMTTAGVNAQPIDNADAFLEKLTSDGQFLWAR